MRVGKYELGVITCDRGNTLVAYEKDGNDLYFQIGRYLIVVSRSNG